MTIEEIISARKIEEILHFTTNHGCLGTLYTKLLQSRTRLEGDEMVEYLFSPNAELRKDIAYLDHVSLSIGHINKSFYDVSAGSWHREEPIFWCILAFGPLIMTHQNVEFATTNNMYTSVERNFGSAGLERLYADQITQWWNKVISRHAGLRSGFPTCSQAEVLYPGAVATDYLNRIYVQTEADQSEVVGFLKASFHRDIKVVVDTQKFGPRSL